MSPSATNDYVASGGLRNPVYPRETVSRLALGKSFPDFPDLLLCEFGLGAIFSPSILAVLSKLDAQHTNSVDLIFAVGDGFEVVDSVVVLDPVLMVQDQAFGHSADKQLINEAVDFEGFYLRGSRTKSEDIVPVLVYTASNDLSASAKQSAHVGDPITIPLGDVCPFLDLFHMGEDTTRYSHTAIPIIPH